MCRSVSIVALPSVAQAFVAGDVVLNSFSRKSAVQTAFHDVAFSRCPFGRTFWQPTAQRKLQHVKLVSVCSYKKEIIKFF